MIASPKAPAVRAVRAKDPYAFANHPLEVVASIMRGTITTAFLEDGTFHGYLFPAQVPDGALVTMPVCPMDHGIHYSPPGRNPASCLVESRGWRPSRHHEFIPIDKEATALDARAFFDSMPIVFLRAEVSSIYTMVPYADFFASAAMQEHFADLFPHVDVGEFKRMYEVALAIHVGDAVVKTFASVITDGVSVWVLFDLPIIVSGPPADDERHALLTLLADVRQLPDSTLEEAATRPKKTRTTRAGLPSAPVAAVASLVRGLGGRMGRMCGESKGKREERVGEFACDILRDVGKFLGSGTSYTFARGHVSKYGH